MATKKAKPTEAKAPVAPAPPVVAEVVTGAKAVYVVAQGKSLTTLRGVVSEGEAIEPSDFCCGKEDFDTHLKNEVIVANK